MKFTMNDEINEEMNKKSNLILQSWCGCQSTTTTINFVKVSYYHQTDKLKLPSLEDQNKAFLKME